MNADSECPTFDNTVVNDIRNIENGNGEYGLGVFNYDEPNDVSGWGDYTSPIKTYNLSLSILAVIWDGIKSGI